jgi:regulator of sirC expression with transglutaminase-like and TPR domain
MPADPKLPIAPRFALTAIGELPDPEIDIAEAALQLARVDEPGADWLAARSELSDMARQAAELAASLGRLPDPEVQAETLGGLLVGKYGFRGDVANYDDLANANLIRVVERRKGLPVALGIIWLHAAHAAGWAAHGVDFPGHFLIALEGRGSQLVIDVFDGGTPLDARELRALMKRVAGEEAELRPGILRPMSTRAVLLRLQNNIKSRRLAAADMDGALACVDDMLRIAPDHASLWREAGTMNQRLGAYQAAIRCYERFLDLVPASDEAALRVRATMEDLRARLH